CARGDSNPEDYYGLDTW
nr:immunoglobulin heavy chain junction region [Macaca mulatta]MOW77106.1 immunoglobulin heavy chain junction region [Macaca mulatta]MOW77289.1 immunoglobulin heavy chain junction region [Macaca mulatta]MOW78801.1 immunoglobulin heavy chain junction region [Macaca mulatta]MOW79086.1 immunoglobulin heavy chain junction region [Macaca mulatta]